MLFSQAAVRDYMLQSNRPYSCINVFDNLHKKIPKREALAYNSGARTVDVTNT